MASYKRNGDMATVTAARGVRIIHVETPLGIVNIYLGLHDEQSRRVERVVMIPNQYAGEPRVEIDPATGRFIEESDDESPPSVSGLAEINAAVLRKYDSPPHRRR